MVLYLKYLFFFLVPLPSTCFTFKSSWIISVELAIGPEEGISYLTDKGRNVSVLQFGRKGLALVVSERRWPCVG